MFFHGYVSHNQMVYVFFLNGVPQIAGWFHGKFINGELGVSLWLGPYGDGSFVTYEITIWRLNMVTIGYINSLSRWISVVLHSWHSKDIGFGISDCRLEVTGGSALENMEFPTASKWSKQIHRFPIDLLQISYRCPWIRNFLLNPPRSAGFCRHYRGHLPALQALQDDVVTVSL